MPTPRPSLNALHTFEAVARLRSMTLAAEELCVTHGAVSRQIKALEETLGLALLRRTPHASEPTAEGLRLAEGLATAFGLIDASLEQLQPGPLTLSCSASVLMHWLLPRMARFQAQHPQAVLQFNMNHDQIDFIRDKVSVAIRSNVIAAPRDALVRELAIEHVGPVCSPAYLNTTRLACPADLADVRRLSTRTRPQAWSDWMRAASLPGDALPLAPQESYEHFYLLIQAAACGLGVAVVPQMLVQEELCAGRLVAPLGFVPGPRRLQLWVAPHLGRRADILALERWLVQEMGKPADA